MLRTLGRKPSRGDRQQLARPHEQLPDRGAAGARCASRAGGVHRHLTPAEHPLALGAGGALEQLPKALALVLLEREEAHQHPVAAGRRQVEVHDGAQQLVWHLHEDPRAVSGRGVGSRGAAMLEVLEPPRSPARSPRERACCPGAPPFPRRTRRARSEGRRGQRPWAAAWCAKSWQCSWEGRASRTDGSARAGGEGT